jgi:hypothetical protein
VAGVLGATVLPAQAPSTIVRSAANEMVRIVIDISSFSVIDEDTPTPLTVWNRLERKRYSEVNLR